MLRPGNSNLFQLFPGVASGNKPVQKIKKSIAVLLFSFTDSYAASRKQQSLPAVSWRGVRQQTNTGDRNQQGFSCRRGAKQFNRSPR
jgi:hypothetical protein